MLLLDVRVLNGCSGKAEQALSGDALDIVSGDLCHAFSRLTFTSSDIWPSMWCTPVQQF